MGTEVAAEIPLEKRNLLPFCVLLLSKPDDLILQVYVGFDAIVTDPVKVGFNLMGVDLIFLLKFLKK